MNRSQTLALALALAALAVSPSQAVSARSTSPRTAVPEQTPRPSWMAASAEKLERELAATYGEAQRERLRRGLRQVGDFWRAEDGDAAVFEAFVRANFAGDRATLDTMFDRFQRNLEQLDGHMHEIERVFRSQADLDVGPILQFDEAFAGYSVSAHLADDLYRNKLAFVVLLNFPVTTLDERLAKGETWTRREWAEVRLAQRFARRVPAEVELAIARQGSDADAYIASYNVWMHHLLDDGGRRLFPPKLRLLSHWNLRDQIRADYGDAKDGLAKQRMIAKVMERIVTQTIPAAVVDNPNVDWNPYTNAVTAAGVKDADDGAGRNAAPSSAPEPDTRYATLLECFRAVRLADPYSPTAPTHIARSFDEGREIPEARVKAMLEKVVSSPLAPRVAKLVEARLGRPLEPFDVWYNGFKPRGAYTEAQLDEIVAKRYPTAEAYQKDIPNLLVGLGFSKERAEFLAANIVVDPARGSGHAMGPQMRSEKAHLRTRVEKNGMNYKGYNIAVHEMGHNVEQVFSLHMIDHTLLEGVPNTAFTEALAFVFQNRDLELLGLSRPDATSEALRTLDEFWNAYEIGGVALVDMAVWHWMYDHPNATPVELKEAMLAIARDVWNRYYAPVFGRRDVVLLGIYSHMIDSFLYLPDYPVGRMIAFQIQEQMRKTGDVGREFERMTRIGNVTPNAWMRQATGQDVGPDALLAATERALTVVGGR